MIRKILVEALFTALRIRDEYTAEHSLRVAEYAFAIAKRLGLPEGELERARIVGLLHDIGKIGISDSILRKPGKLSEEEFAMMERHCKFGRELLAQIVLLDDVAPAIYHHHEWWDGKGYPGRLSKRRIPLLSRLVAVAETFDLMTAGSLYSDIVNVDAALAELEKCSGTQFDPEVVEVFTKYINGTD